MRKPIRYLPAVVVGIAAGMFIPVKKIPAGDHGAASGQASPHRPAGLAGSGTPLVMPAENAVAWATECGNTRPQEFFKWLLKADPQPPSEVVDAFFAAWIAKDCDAAFTAAMKLPARFGYVSSETTWNPFFVEQAKGLFWRDPVAGFHWLNQVDGVLGNTSTGHFDGRENQFEKSDPAQVARAVNECEPKQTAEAMATAYGRDLLKRRGLAAAVEWVRSLNTEHQAWALEAIAREWGQADPAAALKFLDEAPSALRQVYPSSLLVAAAFSSSPREGLEWMEERRGIFASSGIVNLLAPYFASKPDEARDYVLALEPGPQRAAALGCLGENRGRMGSVRDAVDWIATLPPEDQLRTISGAIRSRRDNLPDFIQAVQDGALAAENRDSCLQIVIDCLPGNWESNEAGLRKWFAENPGEMQDRLVKEGSEALKGKPADREKFLSLLPPGTAERVLGPQ